MAHYIVCHKKRNNPRMDIRICEKKCPEKDECSEYLACRKIMFQDGEVSPAAEPHPLGLRAA